MGIGYYPVRPSAALAPFVRYLWVGEVPASADHQFTHLAIASCSPRMVFHYGARFSEAGADGVLRPSFSSGIQGPFKKHMRFVAAATVRILGIEFFPYAIPALFSFSAAELTNQYLSLNTFLGKPGIELEEQVMTAANDAERLRIVMRFLEGLARSTVRPEVVAATALIERQKGQTDAAALRRHIPISERQLERLFRSFTGFSPKQYVRITRFEHAVGNLRTATSFTAAALDAGYFDQAHFNHDFLEFTGLHPNGYLKATAHFSI